MINFFKTMAIPDFETERLIIRKLRVSDAEDLFETFQESEYLKYFGITPVKTLGESKSLIKLWVKKLDPDQFIRWAILLKGTGKVIGTIGLHSFISAYKKGAVGYDINPNYQHNGYVQEALQMIMRYFFEDLGYHRLEAIIVDKNTSSIHVVERAGFQREGLMRKWMYNSQMAIYFDAYIYALLDSDYAWGSYDL